VSKSGKQEQQSRAIRHASIHAQSKGSAAHYLQNTIGNRSTSRLLGSSAVEQERAANRVAEDVTSSRAPRAAHAAPCTCNECSKKTASRKVERSGSPLAPAVRAEMEDRLQHDFSDVRVHTDGEAARSADALDAHAYTVGPDIVFGAGEYAPSSASGRRLLAHELTHVVQQAGAAGSGAAPTLQRFPRRGTPGRPRRGSTLPHREAIEYGECLRIMGPESVEYCQREALGEDAEDAPLALRAERVKTDLARLIADTDLVAMRDRHRQVNSAPARARAMERHLGTRRELTGVGSLRRVERFVTGVRNVQSNWGGMSPDARVSALGAVANTELTSAGVPTFLVVDKEPMEVAKGIFRADSWGLFLNEDMVNDATLDNEEAADVANTTLHESRHAEQAFLAARFSAGEGNSAAEIHDQLSVNAGIAAIAVRRRFTSETPGRIRSLGRRMFDAIESSEGQRITDETQRQYLTLRQRRTEAQTALSALRTRVTPQRYSDAVAARNALRDQLARTERFYEQYRSIPYESDAHEVGDMAELAFRGWQ
jgi:hypothetical protein